MTEKEYIDEFPLVLSIEETARALGCGRRIITGMIKDGTLRAVKIGEQEKIPKTELLRFINGGN